VLLSDPDPSEPSDTQVTRALAAVQAAGLTPPPNGWRSVRVREDRHGDMPVTIVRFQPDGYRLGGPHTSVVTGPGGLLLGYTRLVRPAAAAVAPSPDRAREIAADFVERLDAEYAAGLTEQWVAAHDEEVQDADGRFTVSGTKVKTRHVGGLYAWTVVGPDQAILTWERDIEWDTRRSRRSTRMWLHDSWIAAFDGLGPQPAAPYALVRTGVRTSGSRGHRD
jgi:hypothetical protein